MLKKILAAMVMMYAAVSFAAVDVNKATAAELDGIKGIGPAISAKILDEKKKGGNFKDWDDLVKRVGGIGETNAAKLSADGLTVGGASFKGVAAAPTTKKNDKPAAAKDAKDAKPEAKADVKADPKAEAKAKKEAEAKAKADAKKAKADEAKAKKESDTKAMADAKAAKSVKPAADAKADAKPAAKTEAPKAAEPAKK